MFLDFFLLLRQYSLPVTLPEYLAMLQVLRSLEGGITIEDFYFISKTTLIKHEQHLDLFDRLFKQYIEEKQDSSPESLEQIPPEWLEKMLTELDPSTLEDLGGINALWHHLRELLQKSGNAGSQNLKIGIGENTGAGSMGMLPEGVSSDKGLYKESTTGNRTGKRVWEDREYRNLDDNLELNTRNMKMALRRLRILSREGTENELDMDGTLIETCRNGGMLNIQMQPSRQNRVKVLMLLDVGGSMDDYVDLCSQIFSAARYQFKQLEFFYFHNCVYETLWKDNTRRHDRIPTWQVLIKYNREYKVIFVGDASMASYEITMPKGSVEHYNTEAGIVWLNRFKQQFPNLVWLNPTVAGYWKYTPSINLIREWADNRMFPLTINGLTQAMKCLKNPKVRFAADQDFV